jgi:phosphatidate phosphatase APP1
MKFSLSSGDLASRRSLSSGDLASRRSLALGGLALLLATSLLMSPQRVEAKPKKLMVVIFDGFGTPARARVWGRVLEDKGFSAPKKKESRWRRLKRSYRLLESDEVPNAKVALRVGQGKPAALLSDKEGLFSLELVGLPVGRHPVTARLPGHRGPLRVMAGQIVVAPTKPGVAVLSDIDDTVLKTGVGNKLKLIKKVLFGNAHQLKSFPYAPALYRELAARGYPLVFVSGSPINLYPRLRTFFRLRRFPRGSMRLKNLGLGKGSDSLFAQKAYKLAKLREAAALLPGYRFVLIGDSGEKDPEIYRALKKALPRRVVSVLIHNVNKAEAKAPRFAGQLLFGDYRQAARALRKGKLLSAAALGRVEKTP